MNNAELIAALRYCAMHECCDESVLAECKYSHKWKEGEDCNAMLLADAADALEAAEQQSAELKLDNKILKNTIDADKGVMLDRIRYLEAQMPKEAHWVAVQNGIGVCSNCNRQDSIDNMATHCRYCGARMKGEHDGES